MTSDAQSHYDTLLAEHYDWMLGVPFEVKVKEQAALLNALAGRAVGDALAVDLGCGSGLQSLALSELGYRVIAVDFSDKLLSKLSNRISGGSITARHGDIRNLGDYVAAEAASVVVCMGDTLTHLPSRKDVSALLRSVARALRPHGVFVVTYRDLAGTELRGLDRFIPVQGDERRVMTCFLEYTSPETVMVSDLIHVRDDAGHWTLKSSSYPKLRLPIGWLRGEIEAAGLTVVLQRAQRMITVAAVKKR